MIKKRVPYLGAVLTLGLLIWGIVRLLNFPYSGIRWAPGNGLVNSVDPAGPANGLLYLGDTILTVDSVPQWLARFLPGKRIHDQVTIIFRREGETSLREVKITLTSPPLRIMFLRLGPILMAAVFWLIGLTVLAFSPVGVLGSLFFVLSQTIAVTLISSAVGFASSIWISGGCYFLTWWCGALLIHFHLLFPIPVSRRFLVRALILGYGLTAVASLSQMMFVLTKPGAVAPVLPQVNRLWLAICFAVAVILMVHAFRHSSQHPGARQQIGFLVGGVAIAVTPFIFLCLLPDIFWTQPLLPYHIAYYFVLMIPLSYGYAILRYRLIPVERYVSRVAASTFVGMVLVSAYFSMYGVWRKLAPHRAGQPFTILVLAILIASTWGVLYRSVLALVYGFLYGGWYDYRSAIRHMSRTIGQMTDEPSLAQALSQIIQQVMQLENVILLLASRDGEVTVVGLAGDSPEVGMYERVRFETTDPLWRYFELHGSVTDGLGVRKALDGIQLSEDSSRLLLSTQACLWLPLCGHERLVGLLVLGYRRGGEVLAGENLEGLEVAARQAALAFENAALMAESQQRASERAHLHRQTLMAREEERKHLSRELHDEIIQSLVGVNYHLSDLQADLGDRVNGRIDRLQDEVRDIIEETRQICANLRPPALDSLGLVAAMRARLREAQADLNVSFHFEGDEEQEIPEEATICAYRVLQEAMQNIRKHARANNVQIDLKVSSQGVSLNVTDDGRGFTLPVTMGELAERGHFGLLGMRERVELVGGTFRIESTPGQGTHLDIWLPLRES